MSRKKIVKEINPALLKVKFQQELEAWMSKERLDPEGLAYLLNCHKETIRLWLRGQYFPGRDNALKLCRFSVEVGEVIFRLVGMHSALDRMAEHRRRNRKLKAVA